MSGSTGLEIDFPEDYPEKHTRYCLKRSENKSTDPAGIEPASLGSKPKRMSSTLWIQPFPYFNRNLLSIFLPTE